MRITRLDKWLSIFSAIIVLVFLGILPALESRAAIASGPPLMAAWGEHLDTVGWILLLVWGLRLALAVFAVLLVMFLNSF